MPSKTTRRPSLLIALLGCHRDIILVTSGLAATAPGPAMEKLRGNINVIVRNKFISTVEMIR